MGDTNDDSIPAGLVHDVSTLEADQMHQLAGWSGHAGPLSSWSYINQYEEPLSHWARLARPSAWSGQAMTNELKHFPNLVDDPRPLAKDASLPRLPPPPVSGSKGVSLVSRVALTQGIASGMLYDLAGARTRLSPELTLEVLREVLRAMAVAGLTKTSVRSVSEICEVIRGYDGWVSEAGATKLAQLIESLSQRMAHRDIDRLRQMFNVWRQARDGEHLSLDDGYVGSALIRKLIELGVDQRAMFIKSRQGAPCLDEAVKRTGLRVVLAGPRQERVQHRLQLIDADTNPQEGYGKQVSVVGLHWLMVLVASWLMTEGELQWS